MTTFTGKGRSRLLFTVGTAMAVSLIASGAQAAESDVTPNVAPATPTPTGVTNTAHDVITTVQQKILSTEATLSGAIGGVNTTDSDLTNDPVDATSVTVASNSQSANATANSLTSSINLAVVPADADLGTGEGASAQGVQINLGPVSSTASDSEIEALLQNFSLGSVAVTGNTTQATTVGNSGSTTLQGAILPDYASAAQGSSKLAFGTDADWLNATGSLLASTIQIQNDGLDGISNSATADGNSVLLSLINTVDDASVNAAPVLGDNTIAATVAGNSSNSTIDVQGGASAFAGTAVISNGQVNSATDDTENSIIAANDGSAIIATIAADGDLTTDDAELHGALSVTGNAITSDASGNQAVGAASGEAGNRIQLADGMSFQGAGGDATPGSSVAYDHGTLSSTATGDLAIHNSQGNVGAANANRLAITGSTDDGAIAAVVNDISGGSVAVSDNQITGTASGNSASSAFGDGANIASFAGSVAVANQQTNLYTNVLAEGTGDIYANVTDTAENQMPDSTVSVDGNTVAAHGYGNSASQNLSLDAAVQNLPLTGVTLTAGTGPDGHLSAEGSATVANVQSDYSSNVGAREVHNVYATAGAATVSGSAMDVTGNTGEAVAVGNSGANTLALSGEGAGAGAGIASLQTVDGANSAGEAAAVSASSTGIVHLDTNEDLAGGGAVLSGNLQRGIAYGNSVSNTLSVDGQTGTIDGTLTDVASTVTYYQDADHGLMLDNDTAPSVNAAYGTLNDQSLNGDVTAEALPAYWTDLGSSFAVTVGDDVSGSGIVNDSNALVAAAYGNDAATTSGLTDGNLATTSEDFAAVMNVTNVQTVTPASNISAHAEGTSAVLTSVGDGVDNSTIATSSNTVQALAYGNRASTHQTVAGTNIDTGADLLDIHGGATAAGTSGGETQTDASFSVNNVQYAGGSIGSSLVTEGDPSMSAAILTTVGGDVTGSTIASNGNTLSSGATANRADNLSDLSGNGLATTNALANMQFVAGGTQITSAIGTPGGDQLVQTDPGTPDTPPQPFNFDYSGSDLEGNIVGSNVTLTGGTLSVAQSALTSDEINYLETLGWTVSGEDLVLPAATLGTIALSDYSNLNEGGSANRSETIPLVPGTPASYDTIYVPGSGGVTIAIGGNIDPSTIAVNGNTVAGSVTGNSAANALSTTGTNAATGSDELANYATVDSPSRDATAFGDNALSSVQVLDVGASLTSDVNSTFAIDTTDGASIANSTLTVDGNSQSSRAVGNTVDNGITLDTTNTTAGTSLASFQDGRGVVSATSGMDVSAPVASTGSSVSMSDNSNLALGVMNNATNTLTIDANSAGNIFAYGAGAGIGPIDDDLNSMAIGDNVLLNQQRATDDGVVSATASTAIYNDDRTDVSTSGVANGTVTVTGNSTMAEASANRAVNTVEAGNGAGSSLAASVVVANVQTSDAVVTSSATTSVGVTLAGDATDSVPALNGSNATIGANTTTALARGNAATNALNYSAGATYGAGTIGGASASVPLSGVGGNVTGQVAVLNAQVNTGPVSASSTDASYAVALNGSGGYPVALNGTVGVIGNSVSAAAYGNTASNSVTLTSLNTGVATAAVGNYQANSGSVTATVTTVNYGVHSGLGAISGSSAAVTGNAVTATAVGNNAVSSIATVQ